MKFIYYPWKLRIIIYLCKIISWTANFIIYNSDAGLEYHSSIGFSKNLIKSFIMVLIKKILFFNRKKKKLKKTLGIKSDRIQGQYAGRVDPMKNHNNLLDAFKTVNKRNKKTVLILIGKGTEKLKKQEGVFLFRYEVKI